MSQRPYPEPKPAPLLSVAEWAALPEDEAGELIDGRLVEEEMPDCVHELAVAWLVHTLRAWLAPRRGFVFGSEVKYALKPRRGRKSDVSVFLPTSRKPPARGPVAIPPDIMVEIVSPSPRDVRRDRIEKLEEYAAFGVRWYWLLDPQLRTLEIFELTRDGLYMRRLGVTGGVLQEVPGCDGLALDLDGLFREIDQLDEAEPEEAPAQGSAERAE
ncbi:Uma2 family endonuclease [Sorangium sp. So ce1024]|uniref:Uma2 family endonuclease n=1 Tax=Sorangium sp. So ce1024 TaxID=3133327 RepID=UPI003F03303C